MNIHCDLILDLLSLYQNNLCSEGSEAIIAKHLVTSNKLIKALKGHKYENLILTPLLTGLREGRSAVCNGSAWISPTERSSLTSNCKV